MLVIRHPLAAGNAAPAKSSAFRRACLASLGIHLAVLALVGYLGRFTPLPDGRVPRRLEVRLESRPASAISDVQQTQPDTPTNTEGAKADGDSPIGNIVLTPPEPMGDMPLLIDGVPGTAQLQLDVDVNGKVSAVRVQQSTLEPNTEREMIERMRSVRFRPGLENGKPAASRLVLEIRVESASQ